MYSQNQLKNSSHLKYLRSLTPEQIAEKYFTANDNAKWTDDVSSAKQMKNTNGKPKFAYATSFYGESASFLNGLIVHQIYSQLPNNYKMNAVAVIDDVNKFLAENEVAAIEIFTDLENVHNYAVDFCLELLKTYGKGLAYIRTKQNNHGV